MAKKQIKLVVDLIVSIDTDKTTPEQFVENLSFRIPRAYMNEEIIATKVAVVDSIKVTLAPTITARAEIDLTYRDDKITASELVVRVGHAVDQLLTPKLAVTAVDEVCVITWPDPHTLPPLLSERTVENPPKP